MDTNELAGYRKRISDAIAQERDLGKIVSFYVDCINTGTPITHEKAIEMSGVTDLETIEEARQLMTVSDVLLGTDGRSPAH